MPITPEDTARRLQAVNSSIANQKLEGLTLPPAALLHSYLYAKGECTIEEAIDNLYQELPSAPKR